MIKDEKTKRRTAAAISNMGGYIPPQDIEMEESVLGCVLLEDKSIHRILDIIQEDTFYNPVHSEIWQAILQLVHKNMPIDKATVLKTLRSTGTQERNYYLDVLNKLTQNIVSSVHIDTYARVIEEKAIARRTIMVATKAIQRLYMGNEDLNEVLSDFDVDQFKAKKALISSKNPTAMSIGDQAREQILKGMSTGVVGVTTGIAELDAICGGWRGGRVYTFPARTRMGKTAVAAYCQYKAAEAGIPSVFFTMEMGAVEFFYRLVSLRCRDMGAFIEYSKIDRANISAEEWEIVDQAITYIQTMLGVLIIIDDTTYLTPLLLRSKILKYISDYGIMAAWMDYIQIADLSSTGKGTTADQISDYMTKVKGISKTLDMPMCILSQVDRETEKNGQKGRPMLSNGKGSGAIEEASDMVVGIWRPEVNDPDCADEFGVSEKGIVYLDVLKNKMGETGLIKKRMSVATNFFETEDPYISSYNAVQNQQASPNYNPNFSGHASNANLNTDQDDEPPY